MKIFKKSLLLIFFLEKVNCFLSEDESKIFINLVQRTFVKHCLLAPKEISDTRAIEIIKLLSENQVFSEFLRRENLRKSLEEFSKKIYRWTAIVLKEGSLNSLDYFSNKSVISSFFWLIFDSSNGTLRHEMVQIEIPFDTALLLIEKKKEDNYILSEYYKIKKFAPGVINLFAEWKNNSLILNKKHWVNRKSNMLKYEFLTVKFSENLYLTPKEKVNEAIWEELSDLLNFTIKLRYIQYDPNKKIEELDPEEEEAFLDTQVYLGDSEKFKYLLGPTSQSGLYMHIKAEGEYKGLNRFLKPFSKYTWLTIGCWVCYCGFFEFLIEYFSRKFKCSEKPFNESLHNIFIPLYSLCNQSGLNISDNISSRFVLFLIRASATLLYYAYSATFISYLLLYIPQLPFTDLRGFVEDGTYKITGEQNSDIDTFFNFSVQPLEKLVFEKFLFDVRKWSRLDKEVDRICKGEKLVLVAYDDDVDKYRPCNIVKIKKPLKILANGFKIRFKSPFRGLMHSKLLLLRSTGILQRVNNHILHKNWKKFNTKYTYEISMEKVLAVFKLLFYGCLLSIGILLGEAIYKKYQKKSGLNHFEVLPKLKTNSTVEKSKYLSFKKGFYSHDMKTFIPNQSGIHFSSCRVVYEPLLKEIIIIKRKKIGYVGRSFRKRNLRYLTHQMPAVKLISVDGLVFRPVDKILSNESFKEFSETLLWMDPHEKLN